MVHRIRNVQTHVQSTVLEQCDLPVPTTLLLLLMVGETLSGLQSKLPPSPPDLEFPEQPDNSSKILSVSCAVVDRAIRGFRAGSAGGLDRLRPPAF